MPFFWARISVHFVFFLFLWPSNHFRPIAAPFAFLVFPAFPTPGSSLLSFLLPLVTVPMVILIALMLATI